MIPLSPVSTSKKILLLAAAAFAFAMVAATPSAPIAQTVAPPNPAEAAIGFVRSYAATVGRREVIARWLNPICVQVIGLPDAQAAVVKVRVEDVARSAGIFIQAAGCKRPDIEIGFTADPQATLDGVVKSNGRLLGDPTSGTQAKKTVTLPIQAWYETNGEDVAANDVSGLEALADYRADGRAGLKIPVLYQYSAPGAGQPTPSSNGNLGAGANYNDPVPSTGGGSQAFWYKRQFLNVLVIVDRTQIGGMTLRQLSDYVAMLALAQPRALGTCQDSASITDLFVHCPDRTAPDGLSVADTAYLHALYAADNKTLGIGHSALLAHVVDAMTPLLANPKIVAR